MREHPAVPGVLAYADGFDSPRSSPRAVLQAAGVRAAFDVLLGWTPEARPWLDDADLRGRTILGGYALAGAVGDGRLAYLPVRLSAVPRLLARTVRPDVAVVTGVRRGDVLVFGTSIGWGHAAAIQAERVVVEVDEDGADLGGPPIPGNVVATLPRPQFPTAPPVPRPPSDIDRAIAARMVALLPEEATVQVGPGGLAEAVIAAVDRPVHVWSGLVTDAVADLAARGLLRGPAVCAYTWGSEALHRDGLVSLRPVEETHDITGLSTIDRFVACNTALQVSLDGSVNVERVGGRVVAGIGGHADFSAGATASVGGLSIVALASTTRSGASTIVPTVDCVSTPRADVEVVVTEHGVADLRGVDDAERSRRIAAVAAPEHRAALAAHVTSPKETA